MNFTLIQPQSEGEYQRKLCQVIIQSVSPETANLANLELKGHAVKVNSQLLVLCQLKSVNGVKMICSVPEAKFTAIEKKDIEK